jgi:metal-dependent amidase/aminoacylase/carboxypeptidase family protein
LTQEDLPTTIVTSSAGTSEKIIMKETPEIVYDIRQWAIEKVEEYSEKGVERIYDQMAIMAEFDEWFDPKEDLEVVSLDEITEKQYDDFVENNDGVERG